MTSTTKSIQGKFGKYGGRYVPETLMSALIDLENEYQILKNDNEFKNQLAYLLKDFVGRPTPLYYASNLSKKAGGAKIYIKRRRSRSRWST